MLPLFPSQGDESHLGGPQDLLGACNIANDAILSVGLSLTQGVGILPVTGGTDTTYFLDGHQFLGSEYTTSHSSITIIFPNLRRDQLTSDAWMRNDVEAAFPYDSFNDLLSLYSAPPAAPQRQSRAVNMRKRCEIKYWCSDCGIGCSQSQVLGRHIKDKHQTKQSCPFCSFTWSRGRPHLYKKHLQMRHPQIVPQGVQQKCFKMRQGRI